MNKILTSRISGNYLASLIGAAFAAIPMIADAQQLLEVQDLNGGRGTSLVVAEDEVALYRPGVSSAAALKADVESKVAGAKTQRVDPNRVVVKLGSNFDMAKAKTGDLPIFGVGNGARVEPVLYAKGTSNVAEGRITTTNEVLVKLTAGQTAEAARLMVGGEAVRQSPADGYVFVRFANAYRALDAAASHQKEGRFVSPVTRRRAQPKAIPQDQYFPSQWHLQNTGQGGGLPGIDANVLDAWRITKGSGTTIGIIDDGFQVAHPDLRDGSPPIATGFHHDFNGDDDNPTPELGNSHGTAVGGVAAARQNNGVFDLATQSFMGVTGSAPESQTVGLRLIGGAFTDEEAAQALNWNPAGLNMTVTNNSWGPPDGTGFSILRPGLFAKQALKDAATQGRGGRGIVTVFASGNGRVICCGFNEQGFLESYADDSNLDAYANDRHVIAVAALGNDGIQSSYSEPGANILVSAPSNGGSLGIVTTDVTGVDGYNPIELDPIFDPDYTSGFGGTSSASPLVAGGVALMLSANPLLTYRDVKEILASTAVMVDEANGDWVVRSDGFKFHHGYGAGMVDISTAVKRAKDWVNLPTQVAQSGGFGPGVVPRPIQDKGVANSAFTNFIDLGVNQGFQNIRIEDVELELDITTRYRSDLDVVLTSPNGTRSIMVHSRARTVTELTADANQDYNDGLGGGYVFTTTHCFGENSQTLSGSGRWKVEIVDRIADASIPGSLRTTSTLNSAKLRIYGTAAPFTSTNTLATQRVRIERARASVREDVASILVRVLRVGGTDGAFSVDYKTSDGSAVAGADYTGVEGTLSFNPGEIQKEITIPILEDAVPEQNESLYFLLTNTSGISLGGTTIQRIVINDNEPNIVSIQSTISSASETSAGTVARNGQITISRPVTVPTALDVSLTIAGSATPGLVIGSDYRPLPDFVTIPANQNSVSINVVVIDDANIEGTEDVIVGIVPSGGYFINPQASSATVRILDNDKPQVEVLASDSFAQEKPANGVDYGRIRVTRDNGLDLPLLVRLSYEGTQINGSNYVGHIIGQPVVDAALPSNVTIPAGEQFVEIEVRPIDDAKYTPTKSIICRLLPSEDYDARFGFFSSANISVVEDESVPESKVPIAVISAPKSGARINKFSSADTASLVAAYTAAELETALESLQSIGANVTATVGIAGSLDVTVDNISTRAGAVSRSFNLASGASAEQIASALNGLDILNSNFAVTVTGGGFEIRNDLFNIVEISGTATDPDSDKDPATEKVKLLRCRLDGVGFIINNFAPAAGVSWSVQLPRDVGLINLAPGLHTFEVTAEDETGNLSKSVAISFNYVEEHTLSAAAVGAGGTVSPAIIAPKNIFEVGETVTLTAKPAAGSVFSGWTGTPSNLNSNSRVLKFTMPAQDVSLVANFIPTPYVPAIAGNYRGLIISSQFDQRSSGYLDVNVLPSGTFSGKMVVYDTTYRIKGEFPGNGNYTALIPVKKNLPLELALQIDLNANGSRQITGSLVSRTVPFVSAITADRSAYDKNNVAPASLVKAHNFYLESPGTAGSPEATGYALMKIDAKGTVTWKGVLPDGTKLSQKTTLSKDNTWPLFGSVYRKKGVILGRVSHDAPAGTSEGLMSWFKPISTSDKYFAGGFTVTGVSFVGSTYEAPLPFHTNFSLPSQTGNAKLVFSAGNLLESIEGSVNYFSDNRLEPVATDTNSIKAKINAKTGVITGSFYHPNSQRSVKFTAVTMQQQGTAKGIFLGLKPPGVSIPLRSGGVSLDPVP